MEKEKILLFGTSDSDATIALSAIYNLESDFNIIPLQSSAELSHHLETSPLALLIFWVEKKEEIVALLEICDHYLPAIKAGVLKVVGINLTNNIKVEELFRKRSVTEFLPLSLTEKSLQFKVDLWWKGIRSACKKSGSRFSSPRVVNILNNSSKTSIQLPNSHTKTTSLSVEENAILNSITAITMPPADTEPLAIFVSGKYQITDKIWANFETLSLLDIFNELLILSHTGRIEISIDTPVELIVSLQSFGIKKETKMTGKITGIEDQVESTTKILEINVAPNNSYELEFIITATAARQSGISHFLNAMKH